MKATRRYRRFAMVLLVTIAIATVVVWFTKRPQTTWYAHDADSRQTLKVLFVGNSLTYCHDMPRIVADMFRQTHRDQPLKVAMVTGPGLKLSDHLASGRVLDTIGAQGPWDWVVLQENGGLADFDPEQARQSLKTLADAARRAGAEPIVYVDWHSAAEPYKESRLEKLASTLHLRCVRVADAWHLSREQHPEIDLQMEDGVHPTRAGAYLIALVFHSYLSGEDSIGFRANFDDAGLDQAVAADLQSTVREVVQEQRSGR